MEFAAYFPLKVKAKSLFRSVQSSLVVAFRSCPMATCLSRRERHTWPSLRSRRRGTLAPDYTPSVACRAVVRASFDLPPYEAGLPHPLDAVPLVVMPDVESLALDLAAHVLCAEYYAIKARDLQLATEGNNLRVNRDYAVTYRGKTLGQAVVPLVFAETLIAVSCADKLAER